ncbi:MAG: hypothetical protein ACYC6R_10915 [Anaerolineales bacterium]
MVSLRIGTKRLEFPDISRAPIGVNLLQKIGDSGLFVELVIFVFIMIFVNPHSLFMGTLTLATGLRFIDMHGNIHGEHPECEAYTYQSECLEARDITQKPHGTEDNRPYDSDPNYII